MSAEAASIISILAQTPRNLRFVAGDLDSAISDNRFSPQDLRGKRLKTLILATTFLARLLLREASADRANSCIQC